MHLTLIGTGNVGYHLGQRLLACGHSFSQIFSRTAEKAAELAELLGGEATNNLAAIRPDADCYLLAVSDDSIAAVAAELAFLNAHQKVVAHVSGATPTDVLAAHFDRCGVFYPLQSFSRRRAANFEDLPLCIYSPVAEVEAQLEQLARSICPHVYRVDDEQRRVLHVGAVFVNNFVNYLFSIGEDICKTYQLPFDLLRPLITETVRKIEDYSPGDMQTGPARRGDLATMQRHLHLLERSGWKAYQQIYELLSEAILKKYS